MATNEEHRSQAEHNERLLAAIDANAFPDWIATISFYAAVHWVEVLCNTRGHRTGSHIHRNQSLKRREPDLWIDYRPLYEYSRHARYRCYKANPDDLKYIHRRLNRVKEYVLRTCP